MIFPSIEREIRNHLTELAQERAISVFGENIKNLLLQPPLKGKVVMGFDPGYVNGCKIAVVDANGKFLDEAIVYPHKPQGKVEQAKKTLKTINRNIQHRCYSNRKWYSIKRIRKFNI